MQGVKQFHELPVKIIQKVTFPEEYRDLMKDNDISSNSKLLSLNSFIDENQVIRVGGRIAYSHFDCSTKHPAILPTKHNFYYLVADMSI